MARLRMRRLLRPRFTLWVMLVLITVVAIPLGYVAQRRAWNLRRREVRRQLEETGLSFGPQGVFPAEAALLSGLRRYWRELLLEDENPVSYIEIGFEHKTGERKTPADLSGLRYFPEIESVQLENGPEVTDQSLAVLRFLPQLKYLQLTKMPKVTGGFFEHLANRSEFVSLRLLDLPSLDSPELRRIGEMRKLTWLELVDCPQLTDELFEGVDVSSQLNDLYVWDCPLGDVTLGRWLSQCKLQNLSIRSRVSRALAPALATQTGLIELRIANGPFVDDDFGFLAKCEHLFVLSLPGMPIEGRLLEWIREPDAVERLKLSSTLLRDAHLQHLGRFTKLNYLDLSWTTITGEGFSPDLAWSKLTRLEMVGTRLTDEGKRRLSELDLTGTAVSLPINWTYEDLKRFQGRFPGGILSEREGQRQSIETGGSRYYLTKELSLDEEPLDNFPRDVMAPVLKLHQLARAEADDDAARKVE